MAKNPRKTRSLPYFSYRGWSRVGHFYLEIRRISAIAVGECQLAHLRIPDPSSEMRCIVRIMHGPLEIAPLDLNSGNADRCKRSRFSDTLPAILSRRRNQETDHCTRRS